MYYYFTTLCGMRLQTFSDHADFAVDDLYQQYLAHAAKYEHNDECYRGPADEKYLIKENLVAAG
jgi:hypothetical protein